VQKRQLELCTEYYLRTMPMRSRSILRTDSASQQEVTSLSADSSGLTGE
jgi:hypothetical protein